MTNINKVNFSAEVPPYTSPAQIKKHLGVFGRTTALELEASDPNFPKRIRLGRQTFWRTAELVDYIERAAEDVRPKRA